MAHEEMASNPESRQGSSGGEMSHQFDRISDKIDAARDEANVRDREDQRWKGKADQKMDTMSVDLSEVKDSQKELTEDVQGATQSITVMQTEKATERRMLRGLWGAIVGLVGVGGAAVWRLFSKLGDLAGP